MTNWGGSPKAQLPGLKAAHNLRLVLHFVAPCRMSLSCVMSSPSSAYFLYYSLPGICWDSSPGESCTQILGSGLAPGRNQSRTTSFLPAVTSIEVSFCPELVGPLWRRAQLFLFFCFILEYSQWTVLWWFQVNSEGTYFSFCLYLIFSSFFKNRFLPGGNCFTMLCLFLPTKTQISHGTQGRKLVLSWRVLQK